MPTAPTLGLQVRPQAAPDVRVSPNAPSAAFPGAVNTTPDLSGAMQHVSRLADEARTQADQVAVSAADAQVVRAKTARLWDPNSGAMNARGKDAIPASDAAQAGFRDDADQIEGSLANDRQKEAFRRRVDMHYADLGGQLGQHVATQIKQYDVDTTQGHLEALHDAAVKGYQDPQTVEQAIADTRGTLIDHFRRNGHASGDGVDEFASGEIAKNVSAIRASVFDQLSASGQDLAASSYFQAHQDDFVGHDRVIAERVAKAGSSRALAQTETSRILGAKGDSLTEALDEAGKIEEPTVQDDVTRRIRQHFADKASDLLHGRQQAYQQASKILEDSGGDMDKIPFPLRDQLLPGENEALQHRADQIRHPKDYGDQASYFHLKNLAHISDASRQAFAQENIATGYPKLSDQQRSELLTLQRQTQDQIHRASGKTSPSTPDVAATPVKPATPYNPLGGVLSAPPPTLHATRAMLDDVAKKGPGYASYLRGLGYNIPHHPVAKP